MEMGLLRHRVDIQLRNSTLDAFGQAALTWTTLYTIWASIEDISGKELIASMAINTELSTHIYIRYRAGITTANRVLYQGTTYNIQAVVDATGRKRELHLMCSRNYIADALTGTNFELREDGSFELREDGTFELRE